MHRVGLFGGTFNPIHFGHLRVAEEVREMLGLHRVWFVPAADPPHKEGGQIIPVGHRMEMARLALHRHPQFQVSDFEATRDQTSYSLYTIAHYRELLGKQATIFFIIGADAFAEITTWHRWQEVLTACHFAVMTRPGSQIARPADAVPAQFAQTYTDLGGGKYRQSSGMEIVFLPVTELAISSSDIRRHRRDGRSICFLTPPPVADYIRENDLYPSPRLPENE